MSYFGLGSNRTYQRSFVIGGWSLFSIFFVFEPAVIHVVKVGEDIVGIAVNV